MKPSTPTIEFPGVGPARAATLKKLGIRTAQDLAFFFPRDYEFPAPPSRIEDLVEGEPASLVGEITEAELRSRHAGKSVLGVLVENDQGAVRMMFFNQAFRAAQLETGRRVMLSGKPKLNGLRWEFTHPKVTILDADGTLPDPEPLPIYSLVDKLKQTDLRRLSRTVIPEVAPELSEVLPKSLRAAAAELLRGDGYEFDGPLPEIETAIRDIHFPPDARRMTAARLRFVYQELLVMQLALALRRRSLTTQLRAPPVEVSRAVDLQIRDRFGFALTGDQVAAIEQIRRDMSRQFPMNRLLQGDVGSGKTAVALHAMMLAAEAGFQSTIMAPTEVLARQHYESFGEVAAGIHRVGLLCGSMPAGQRRQTLSDVAAGNVDMLVGTQSLLHGNIQFARLGLCVVDEQHKFGVNQRVTLRSGGVDPHYLVMSATPIPRSVAMTIFGDVDLSTIREKPPGRGELNTYLVTDDLRDRWWGFVRKAVTQGRQAFVVTPRVGGNDEGGNDDGDAEIDEMGDVVARPDDVSSVTRVVEELSSGPLSGLRVAMLHGRMPAAEKQSLMQRFADAEIDVLVSTTVIEVGINVPNATVMTIMGAQRFGLAQLHQLRGRVARGGYAGHVAVMTDGPVDPADNERLSIFEKTTDGFELAEADFRIRGPGEMLGRKQSGMPTMLIADLSRDEKVVATARKMAQEIVDVDATLEDPAMAGLRSQVMRRYRRRMDLGDVA